MRIIAGKYRGFSLAAPQGQATRPTSDRVRQALFNVLEHGPPGVSFAGMRVLDLFAGSGALGLEACSRGAGFCLFVEERAEARAAIRRNVEALGLTGTTKIFRRDATRLGPRGQLPPFDLAFLDPPYGQGLGDQALAAIVEGDWLNRAAIVVIEERADADVVLPAALSALDTCRYGDTKIVIAEAAGDDASHPSS